MQIHITGHKDHLATLELDYPQEHVQDLIVLTSRFDKGEDGNPLLSLIGEPPKCYKVLEYVLAGYTQKEGMPMYRFNRVICES